MTTGLLPWLLARLPTGVPTQLPIGVLAGLPTGILAGLPTRVLAGLPTEVLAGLLTGVLAELLAGVLAELLARLPTVELVVTTCGIDTSCSTISTENWLQYPCYPTCHYHFEVCFYLHKLLFHISSLNV